MTDRMDEKVEAVRFAVKVKPNARQSGFVRDAIDGQPAVIGLNAPPVDGKANRALIEFLAKAFGARKSDVSIVSGAGSRVKTIEVRQPRKFPTWFGEIGQRDGARSGRPSSHPVCKPE